MIEAESVKESPTFPSEPWRDAASGLNDRPAAGAAAISREPVFVPAIGSVSSRGHR